MSITKCKNKELRHYELNIRTTMQDSQNFTAYIKNNKLHKRKKLFNILLQAFITLIFIALSIVISVFLHDVGWNSTARFIVTVCLSFIIVNIVMKCGSRFPKISDSDVEEAIMSTLTPYMGQTEREIFFSLGEDGFSTNAGMIEDIKLYEYRVLKRVIECELGIIMIFDELCIYCIPARYFNDETACFITEKLRKKCRFKYMTKGLMKINRN